MPDNTNNSTQLNSTIWDKSCNLREMVVNSETAAELELLSPILASRMSILILQINEKHQMPTNR